MRIFFITLCNRQWSGRAKQRLRWRGGKSARHRTLVLRRPPDRCATQSKMIGNSAGMGCSQNTTSPIPEDNPRAGSGFMSIRAMNLFAAGATNGGNPRGPQHAQAFFYSHLSRSSALIVPGAFALALLAAPPASPAPLQAARCDRNLADASTNVAAMQARLKGLDAKEKQDIAPRPGSIFSRSSRRAPSPRCAGAAGTRARTRPLRCRRGTHQ